MARIAVFDGDFGTYLITEMLRTHRGAQRYREGRTRLVQTDWDYPGVASALGWSPRAAARECLYTLRTDAIDARRNGDAADPGYF
jgi:hypothetical protein